MNGPDSAVGVGLVPEDATGASGEILEAVGGVGVGGRLKSDRPLRSAGVRVIGASA